MLWLTLMPMLMLFLMPMLILMLICVYAHALIYTPCTSWQVKGAYSDLLSRSKFCLVAPGASVSPTAQVRSALYTLSEFCFSNGCMLYVGPHLNIIISKNICPAAVLVIFEP